MFTNLTRLGWGCSEGAALLVTSAILWALVAFWRGTEAPTMGRDAAAPSAWAVPSAGWGDADLLDPSSALLFLPLALGTSWLGTERGVVMVEEAPGRHVTLGRVQESLAAQQPNYGVRTEAILAAIAAAFPPRERASALAIAWCESHFDPALRYRDINGEWSEGAWSVQPYWWGAVPADLAGQARQAAAIVAEMGWRSWACKLD